MKVLIVVTHLLGSGHLARALNLGRAFAGQGHDTCIVSGGVTAAHLNSDGVKVVQLPPLRSDGTNFTRLLTLAGQVADDTYLTGRTDRLCAAVKGFCPDVLITELFPFGRRVLADEFLAGLDAARGLACPPVILSSVRDILAPPSKPAKARQTADIVERLYDAVLVHSDPHGTPLDLSWPVTASLRERLRYTGYVAPPPATPDATAPGRGEILVSAGGGGVGDAVFQTALQAARTMPGTRWRILVGGADPGQTIDALNRQAAGSDVIIEPARPEFRTMLLHASASVSLCGYNTALDVLQSRVPAVFVPFDEGGEVEQSLRATALARLGSVQVVRAGDLSADQLCRAVSKVIESGRRSGGGLQFDGAAQTVAIATAMAEART